MNDERRRTMSGITTHVLDVSRGRPAAGLSVELERRQGDAWAFIGGAQTDMDGRVRNLLGELPLEPGEYRLTFETGEYFAAAGVATLYPTVVIVFEASADQPHYHVPLLLSPFGYTTYRGT
jgi:5-hydroxyisourate hydrolase